MHTISFPDFSLIQRNYQKINKISTFAMNFYKIKTISVPYDSNHFSKSDMKLTKMNCELNLIAHSKIFEKKKKHFSRGC